MGVPGIFAQVFLETPWVSLSPFISFSLMSDSPELLVRRLQHVLTSSALLDVREKVVLLVFVNIMCHSSKIFTCFPLKGSVIFKRFEKYHVRLIFCLLYDLKVVE